MIRTVNKRDYYIDRPDKTTGQPWMIMLHGFMGSSRAFQHLDGALNRYCNPVYIDLFGHGRSDGSSNPDDYSEERQLHDLKLLVESLPVTKTVLHGYSMGGRLALRFALNFPDLLQALILESTTFGIPGHRRPERQKVDERRAQEIENDYDAFLERWSSMPLFQSEIEIPAERENRYREIQRRQKPEWMAASLRGFGSGIVPSVKSSLPGLDRPVLLICGQNDEKYRAIHLKMDRLLPNSRSSVVKQAGHRVHLEQPSVFVQEIESFINQQ